MKKPYVMKFGKFSGQPVTAVSTDWLIWALNNLNLQKTPDSVFRALFDELTTRSIPNWEETLNYLRNSNILPHGGLYRFAWVLKPENEVVVMMNFTRKKGMNLNAAMAFQLSGGLPRRLSILPSCHLNGRPGVIDTEAKDWVTLDPNGNKMQGKLLVNPYYIHFPHETFIQQQN